MRPATSDPVAKQAKQRIQALAGQLRQLVFIHYDCGRIEKVTPGTVPVLCIVVQPGDGSGQRTFGGAGGDERKLLDDFAAFATQHRGPTWIHWSMRDSRYGFDAITQRHEHLGGKPLEIPAENRFDLAQALLDIYGDGYVGHPRLLRLLEANDMATDDLLTLDKVGGAWVKGDYGRVLANTLRRVRGMRELFVLESKGELRTRTKRKLRKKRGKWPVTRTSPAVAKYLSEHSGLYNKLVPLVLKGDTVAFKEFNKNFGATAIATKIAEGAGEPGSCGKSQVQKTVQYEQHVKPLLRKPPERPSGWRSPKTGAALHDFLNDMGAE